MGKTVVEERYLAVEIENGGFVVILSHRLHGPFLLMILKLNLKTDLEFV